MNQIKGTIADFEQFICNDCIHKDVCKIKAEAKENKSYVKNCREYLNEKGQKGKLTKTDVPNLDLLKDYGITFPTIDNTHITWDKLYDVYIPNCCKSCSNHPSNGGSGYCNCILPYFEEHKTPIKYNEFTCSTTTTKGEEIK